MYAFGGDPLVLYYNTAYHAQYGQDATLRNMNYPDGEYIYLTDAQGALSCTLQWINRHVTDISQYSIGIVNALNLYLLFLAVIFLFFLLRAFRVHYLTAILFSPLILLLSPQIPRLAAHFGLAYPFLIPMAMLWFVRKYRVGRLEKRDALFFLTALFFTFNNPYTGFNINFFLILSALVLFAAEGFDRKKWKRPAIIGGMGMLVLSVVFINFKIFDPVKDRISPQWGFFDYRARVEGLFYPEHSLLRDWLGKQGLKLSEVPFEASHNVGLIVSLALLIMVLLSIAGMISKKNASTLQRLIPEQRMILGGALLLYVLAANVSLIPVSKVWLENHMGWLLMFKASGRLAWPAYFALTLAGVVFIDRIFRITAPWFMAGLFLLGTAALWNAEFNQYMRYKFKDASFPNYLSGQYLQEVRDTLQKNRVDPAQYQALLCVPRTMAWSDKMNSDIPFNPHFYATQISLATGMPMLNSTLSRIGLQHTLERVQMLSNPLIERTLLQKLPNQKDILLVLGNEALPNLKSGEKFLIDISEQVAKTKDCTLYRLKLADLLDTDARKKARETLASGAYAAPVYHLGFDENRSEHAFYGQGSHQTQPGEETLGTFVSPFERDTQMVFSAWTYVDATQWSVGYWHLNVKDAQDNEVSSADMETRNSNDVQDHWVRSEITLRVPKGGKVLIKAAYNKPMLVDEVMFWPKGSSPILQNSGDPAFLFENFRVSL